MDIVREHRLDGLNIENVDELDADYIKKVKDNNLMMYCWTVNEPKRAAYIIRSRS